MNNFHPLSFGLGIACGVIVAVVGFFSADALQPHQPMHGSNQAINGNWNTGNRQDMVKRMAQRLGMTEEELTKELTAGKTMIQIVKEHQKDASASGSGTVK